MTVPTSTDTVARQGQSSNGDEVRMGTEPGWGQSPQTPRSLPVTQRLAARFLLAAAALSLALSLGSCAGGAVDRADLVLGTVCSVRILSGGSEKALGRAFARLREIENEMSANADGTVVDAINRNAGIAPVAAPDDVRGVVRQALDYARRSGGFFDPTIGPVVKLWNIGLDGERLPGAEEISAALPLVDWSQVAVDDTAGTVYLRQPAMRLDLGAIAKGYAADEVERILLANRVKAAVVDLGGNIKVVGSKPDGSAWRVGIQNPFDERGSYIGIATLQGGYTVVTSGIYERYFIGDDGRHYHHIFNPATGYPADNGLVSVTVLCRSSMEADGLSTTLFSLGLEDGLSFAETLEGVEAVFIDAERRVYPTSGATALFSLTDPSFTLATPR